MRSFYCVLYDDDQKLFDYFGPVSDDTAFTESVVEGQNRGLNIRCGTVESRAVKSEDEIKKDDNPKGYRYHRGLFSELGIYKKGF